MLRALAAAGVPVPAVEAEFAEALLLEHVANDRAFTPRTWADIGGTCGPCTRMRMSCTAGRWITRWVRCCSTISRPPTGPPSGASNASEPAQLLDLPLAQADRCAGTPGAGFAARAPPAALLHGDLWGGNLLVREGRLAAFIDPACYHGDAEVDLAMLCLFDDPDPASGRLWTA
jgi:hypothetical protein